MIFTPRKGFAVQISRKDGTAFLAAAANGIQTPIWIHRKYAVAYKRELRAEGFKARVVKVLFANPIVVSDGRPKKCPTCGNVCRPDDLKCDECGHDLVIL